MALSTLLSNHWDPYLVFDFSSDTAPVPVDPRAFAPVDVREAQGSYTFQVDVPGMNKDQVKVQLENQVLTIIGERKQEAKREGVSYHRMERLHGRFERKFRLPKNANGEAIKAAVKDGVLTVEVAKKQPVEPKTVEVQIQES